MSKIIPASTQVNNGQNVVDLAIQEMGHIEGLVALLRQNGLSVNDDPETGMELDVIAEEVVDNNNRKFFRDRKVNTGFVDTEILAMIFQSTFPPTFN